MQMLLFYGLNTTSGTSFPVKAASSGAGTPSAKYQGAAGGHSEASTPGFGGHTGSAGGQGHGTGTGTGTGTDAIKQRKLEERMGPGGTGHQTGARRVQSQRGQKNPYLTPATADPYEDPALHFSGNQQFFFRFIVHTDNHRFLRCLEESMAAEIKDLTKEHAQRSSGGGALLDTSIASNGAASSPMGRGRSGSQLTDGEEYFSSASSSSNLKSTNRDGAVDGFESFDTPQYTSSTQSFALRTVKLRILGKFLGLLTFWPQWSLLVSTGDRGPLSLLARDAARIRGALRPATSYPLRSILEKAWVACRLSYTVPWVVEFLKMMVWDCTYTHVQNPYRDVFGCLRSIQRSDLLHPIKGRASSNRLYVLIEIQNLWSVVSLSDVRRTALPPMRSKPKLDYGSDRSLDIDEQSRAFSLSFLHHVATSLNEALNVIKKRLQLNLAKRSPMPQAHTAPLNRSAISPAAAVAVGTADIVFSTKKRQTPNLVGLLSTSEAPLSSPAPVPVGGLSAFSPSVYAFSSPSSSTSKKTLSATTELQEMVAIDTLSAPSLSVKGGIATSLMAQFSAAAAVKHNKLNLSEADSTEVKSWSGSGSGFGSGGLSSQRMGGSPSPHVLRGTPKGMVPGTGTGPGSATKTPRSRAASTAASGTTTLTATPTAARSIQHAASPFRGGDAAGAEDVTPRAMTSDSTSLTDRCGRYSSQPAMISPLA
jgi:hypothetical protein